MILTKARVAGPQDIRQLYEMLLEFRETEFPDITPNNRKIYGYLLEVMDQGIIFVTDAGGVITGSIAVKPSDWWFSDDVFLMERWFYVRKSYRGSIAALQLLRKLKKYQQMANVPLLMTLFARRDVERKNRLFRRYFQSVGEMFSMGLRGLGG